MNKFEFFKTGSVQSSYGGQYSYKVIGPCCRLYDREELPWPCSRLAWRSKEPSWRRIGSRFVADMASRKCPSYSVQIFEPGFLLYHHSCISEENFFEKRVITVSTGFDPGSKICTE